jgi:CTP synthase
VVFCRSRRNGRRLRKHHYLEACRQLAYEEGENSVGLRRPDVCAEPGALGEQKSKAAQLGIKRLMEVGIMPHIIACRARNPVKEKVREKISMYTNVPMKRVVTMHDVESIYTIPEALREAGIDREVLTLLDLHDRVDQRHEDQARMKWRWFVDRIGKARREKSPSPSPANTPPFAMPTPASSRPASIAACTGRQCQLQVDRHHRHRSEPTSPAG